MKQVLTQILFLSFLLLSAPGYAQLRSANMPSPLDTLLSKCLPALVTGQPPAALATDLKFPEFAPEQAIKFAPEGGRVFTIPEDAGNAVFITNKNFEGVCSVAVREADATDYHNAIDRWFGPQSPFTLIRETRNDDAKQTRRDYRADIGGIPLVILITIADMPRNDGIQILMTAARTGKEP